MSTRASAVQDGLAAAARQYECTAGQMGTLLRRARAAWIVSPAPPHQPGAGIACPRCRESTGAMALLTPYLTYFACSACRHRWEV